MRGGPAKALSVGPNPENQEKRKKLENPGPLGSAVKGTAPNPGKNPA